MLVGHRCSILVGRRGAIAGALTLVLTFWPVSQASAGLLDFLFEKFQSPSPAPAPPPQALSYGDPGTRSNKVIDDKRPAVSTQRAGRTQASFSSVRGATYCVRLCDGRFFPMPHQIAGAQAHTCHALCPASQTKVFRGNEIGRAVAADGVRYAALDNAFAYRKRFVPGCTCNGKDGLGLARIDIDDDLTLRAGDVVATQSGRVVFEGRSSMSGANFTAMDGDRPRTTDRHPGPLAAHAAASAN